MRPGGRRPSCAIPMLGVHRSADPRTPRRSSTSAPRRRRHGSRSMELACTTIVARAEAGADGVLVHDGAPLTSRARAIAMIDAFLMRRGTSPTARARSSRAAVRKAHDCHDRGRGPAAHGASPSSSTSSRRTSPPLYHGDCTRCVVHGDVPDAVARHARRRSSTRSATPIDCLYASATTGEQRPRRDGGAVIDRARLRRWACPPEGAGRRVHRHGPRHGARHRARGPRAAAAGPRGAGACRGRCGDRGARPLLPRRWGACASRTW
jgi:hypothetical protein